MPWCKTSAGASTIWAPTYRPSRGSPTRSRNWPSLSDTCPGGSVDLARGVSQRNSAAARARKHIIGDRWHVDETYLKVDGSWRYLFRAIDQFGQVIDVYLSPRRD